MNLQKTDNLRIGFNLKRILALGTPLLAGRLSHYSHQVADSIMMGHFNESGIDLGALAIAGMFFWVLNTLLWPLANGVQAIVTRRQGAGGDISQPHRLGEVLDQGVFTSMLFACAAFGLSFLARPIFSLMLENEKIIELGAEYIAILRWSFFPFAIQNSLMRFFSSIHKPKHAVIVSFVSNAANIILNYIFIYGKLGLPQMGIRGAALGSLLSTFIGCTYLVIVALKKDNRNTYRFFHSRKLDFKMIGNIIRIAAPPAVQNCLAMLIMMFFEAMVENLGAVYLAAAHIVLSFYRINKTVVGGYSHGAAIFVGNELGAGNKEAAKKVMQAGYLIGAAIGTIVFAFVFFFPSVVAGFFTAPGETMDIAISALKFFAPFFFLEILGFTFEMVFIGNGWGRFVLFSEFLTNVLFILGFTFVTTRILGLGITYAWLGFGLYQAFHSLLLHIGFKTERWTEARID